jgi:hypothetical protein
MTEVMRALGCPFRQRRSRHAAHKGDRRRIRPRVSVSLPPVQADGNRQEAVRSKEGPSFRAVTVRVLSRLELLCAVCLTRA